MFPPLVSLSVEMGIRSGWGVELQKTWKDSSERERDSDLGPLFPFFSFSFFVGGCSCDGETPREWIGHRVDIQWTCLAQAGGQQRKRRGQISQEGSKATLDQLVVSDSRVKNIRRLTLTF